MYTLEWTLFLIFIFLFWTLLLFLFLFVVELRIKRYVLKGKKTSLWLFIAIHVYIIY